jgi:hypothetical protein
MRLCQEAQSIRMHSFSRVPPEVLTVLSIRPYLLSCIPPLFSSLLMSVSRILVARNAAGIVHRNAVPFSVAHFTPVVHHRPHTLAPARFLHSTTPCWTIESQRSSLEGPVSIPSVPADIPPDWQHPSYGFTLETLPRVIFLMKLLGKTTESDVRALFTENRHEV